MNRTATEKRVQILSALVEGTSLRAVSRMTGIARNTITTLLVDAGLACGEYQDAALRNLRCRRIQADEIWSFCYSKEKNVPKEMKGQFGVGDIWTWTALDADTKLMVCWAIGDRSAKTASLFMDDLANRLRHRVQLTTDGHKAYLEAVEGAFGNNIDFAQLIKIYGEGGEPEKRYSPAVCMGAKKETITGTPITKHISTSYVERQNLTMRMHMRRFTRLTNAFSKKVDNHIAAIALHFMYYNFIRIHQTLRVTPAMAAGVTNRVWEIADIIQLIDERAGRTKAEKLEAYRQKLEQSYSPF